MPTLETAPAAEAQTLMLEQTRTIRAPRTRVYDAWTSPETLKQWFGPAGMYCPSVSLDLRVGGAYRIDVHPTPEAAAAALLSSPESAQRRAFATGKYTKIVPNELLQFTWEPSWQPDEHSLVTVLLKDAPGGTGITIRHERFTTEASREGHGKGWAGCLDKLTETLEATTRQ